MTSNKCPSCKLVNFSYETECKRCHAPLEQITAIAAPMTTQMAAPVMTMPLRAIRCPYCDSMSGTYQKGKVSTGGWVMFAILLLLCFLASPFALLIQDYETFCVGCNMKLAS